ncbi:MAG: metallophosphoesterase [Methanomassiliicoccales archaeon]
MQISPVVDHPALRIFADEAILCAGDLHIGLEDEMRSKGVVVPSQTERMLRELKQLADGCERLVLLGDVKHQVPGTSRQEYSELPRFFSELCTTYSSVDLVRGNHDVGIEDIGFTGVHIHPASGFSLGDVGFIHGHIWPSDSVMSKGTLIMAHNHPAILFRDGVGHITIERCWLRCRLKEDAYSYYSQIPSEVIVVPSMNRSLKGSPINIEEARHIGPLFANSLIELEDSRVYLLDGIYLGTVGSLMVKGPNRYLD